MVQTRGRGVASGRGWGGGNLLFSFRVHALGGPWPAGYFVCLLCGNAGRGVTRETVFAVPMAAVGVGVASGNFLFALCVGGVCTAGGAWRRKLPVGFLDRKSVV